MSRYGVKKGMIWLIILVLLIGVIAGCRKGRSRPFVIGIAAQASSSSQTLKGFREGMAELGYVDGIDVRYVYYSRDTLHDDKVVDAEIKRIAAGGIDLLLTINNETALMAKAAVEGTDTPVVAAACSKPMEIGLVGSITHPEGNVTGVTVADSMSKGLEFLVQIVPDAKKVYLPYNPEDSVSTLYLSTLIKASSGLGIELVLDEISSIEETVAHIETLSDDIDAVYAIPSGTLSAGRKELSRAAIDRGIPLGAGVPFDGALVTLGVDLEGLGRQASRIAHQILQGLRPVDLPFETSEAFLTINMDTAKRLGIQVPEGVLFQAGTIIY